MVANSSSRYSGIVTFWTVAKKKERRREEEKEKK